MPKANIKSLESIRKEEILKASLTSIADEGTINVTLDSIAKAAGFSKGGITYYYSSKEVLLNEVFKYFHSIIHERAIKYIAKQTDPLQKLRSCLWLYNADDSRTKIMIPLLLEVMSMATKDSDYHQAFKNWTAGWVVMLEEIIEEGNACGQFQVEDIEETAKYISCALQGVATRWNLSRDSHSKEWAHQAFEKIIAPFLKTA